MHKLAWSQLLNNYKLLLGNWIKLVAQANFSQDFQSLENSDSEATSWPQDQEDTPDLIPNYDIYEENQAQK